MADVLVVDNHDSFVHTLVGYLHELGATTTMIEADAVADPAAALAGVAGVLVSPGPGRPETAGASVEIIRAAAGRGIPVLGVCLGHQALAVAFGGIRIEAMPVGWIPVGSPTVQVGLTVFAIVLTLLVAAGAVLARLHGPARDVLALERTSLNLLGHLSGIAIDLFIENGFDETSVDDIAAAAGIARRTLFRYYPSKNSLAWGEFDDHLRELRTLLAGIPRETPMAQALVDGGPVGVDALEQLGLVRVDRGHVAGDVGRQALAVDRRREAPPTAARGPRYEAIGVAEDHVGDARPAM